MSRAPLLALFLFAFLGCEGADRLNSPASDGTVDLAPTFAASRLTGIPFGSFGQPISLYGLTYTGGLLNPQPETVLSQLADIRAAKGRVVLSLAGGPGRFTNADRTFNFDLWKQSVDRYTTVDPVEFGSYIEDGTIIAHYLIDQPNCGSCWGGQPISQETVEAMAQYSKSLWENMVTVARSDPTWLAGFSGEYVHLDAGWAQYVVRKGDAKTYLSDNVAAAQSKGLGLIVGLNLLDGNPDGASLTASQIKDFGSVLLGSAYPCAFISWKYDAAYFEQTDIKSALALLSKKAARHVSSSCKR